MYRFLILANVVLSLMTGVVEGAGGANSTYGGEGCRTANDAVQGLDQDWPAQDRAQWYELSQGSRLIPLAWYEALRLPGQDGRFSDHANQNRYALQFCEDSGLPIGFVVDEAEGRAPALGLTCSACHTGVLNDGAHKFIVEGGSSSLDLQTYMTDMFSGLVETFRDAGVQPGSRWTSFAHEVLGEDHSAQAALDLEVELRDWLQRRYQIQQSIDAGGKWGHGRTDAVAVILNTATVLSGQRAGVVLPPSSAPTSFPHVWNAPQMQRVQWNGSATKVHDMGLVKSMEFGAILRNLSEVLGVFAEIELATDQLNDTTKYPSIKSSAKLANLVRLERTMQTLKSPAWPDEWGRVDTKSSLYQRGRALYDENCVACHAIMDRKDLSVKIWDSPTQDIEGLTGAFTKMVPVFDMSDLTAPALGTDPLMACNALTHTSWTGKFEQLHNSFDALRQLSINKDIAGLSPQKFEKGTATLRLIEELALRMSYEKRGELMALQKEDLQQQASAFFHGMKEGVFGVDPGKKVDPASVADRPIEGTHALKSNAAVVARCVELLSKAYLAGSAEAVPAYKARPLNGIFASPPYLHNGSVPTIADLLKPTEHRPEQFLTGYVLYDSAQLGLGARAGTGPTHMFSVRDGAGEIIPGNANSGHNYAPSENCATLSTGVDCDADRTAILEYLKTL